MKNYQSFDEINRDLKRLSLEKQIALEELKIVKSDFEEMISPLKKASNIFKFVGKYGILMLLKKKFK